MSAPRITAIVHSPGKFGKVEIEGCVGAAHDVLLAIGPAAIEALEG